MAGYKPLFDAGRNVIGMLYVGVPEAAATEPLRRTLMDIRIGRTGYVYVLNASGTQRGHYVVSSGGKRDGEDIWDSRDSSGNYFIQEICRKAAALGPEGVASHRYPWQNRGEPRVYQKIVYLKYFRAWDWVLGASLPEEEAKRNGRLHRPDCVGRSARHARGGSDCACRRVRPVFSAGRPVDAANGADRAPSRRDFTVPVGCHRRNCTD
jgi:hypothetical protein